MWETERLRVGRIVGTHGIRGEVRVKSFTDFPERRFAPQTRLFLSHPSLTEPMPVVVKKSRSHKNLFLIQFEEWDRIDEVERWRDAELWIPIAEAAVDQLNEDEFYSYQIIGCSVKTTDDRSIGKIKEILSYPANDIWVVESTETDKEILLPVTKEIVKKVDITNKLIIIEWMEGLESL